MLTRPLWLKKQNMVNRKRELAALTADGGRLLEDLGDLWVHVDHEVLLHCDLLVSHLDLLADPPVEGLPDDGRANVTDPLLGRFGQFELWLRKIVEDLPVIGLEEHKHLLDAETLVPVNVTKDKR